MNDKPKDWKTYDEFAYGIDTNRLPATEALAGSVHRVNFDDGRRLELSFGKGEVRWSDGKESATDRAEVIEVASNAYFVEIVFAGRPQEAETLIVNVQTRRALSIYSIVRDAKDAVGEPQVAQIFRPGIVEGAAAGGPAPAESRDLIGLRAHFTYSPNHVYEHTYLSSERYAWQCLVGVQRGHGDVDLTTTYKFDENQYVFTFREFKIPVASTFFYNFDDMRSTGKFLGIAGDGRIQNSPAGAFIRKASMTYYLPGQEPV
ncbi:MULTISPECIES: MoaF C-terminal domain-containing protein [unclassified Rhizobium]|uniref:MoaF C-terminal domain-containing protein n=1 Tax=unclassified Rhizobium TaxID=2613769 RepID=UPI0007EBAE40|nr:MULTISPECIES: MoaF C-terminal domain-containing protein [unclassified Rhizobium]ANM12988.1 molybdenum cofactor biosynthesis protein F [Rhizobium sp. N324]OYD01449.1 molybdenum cofactor biosynthesis protein F [Rhizobium sp. N4311]